MKRVLVVTLSAILRKGIKDRIERDGKFQGLLERGLDQAAILVKREKPDAAIVDGEMSFQVSATTVRRIPYDPVDFVRALMRVHPVPCLYFDESPERREAAELAGACKTLLKPDMKDLERLTAWIEDVTVNLESVLK